MDTNLLQIITALANNQEQRAIDWQVISNLLMPVIMAIVAYLGARTAGVLKKHSELLDKIHADGNSNLTALKLELAELRRHVIQLSTDNATLVAEKQEPRNVKIVSTNPLVVKEMNS